MEMHHKLRRDPNWHPNACNLCGQMGHQAAQCSNGTINWKAIYGEKSFRIMPALFPSDLEQLMEQKKIDEADIQQKAAVYAKGKCEEAGLDYEAVCAHTVVWPEEYKPAPERKKDPKRKAEEAPGADGLPPGWAEAKDAQGRVYFWHTKTKKVQWEKPTPETPVK